MPSDSNGVYSLPDGYRAETGELVLASQHNLPLEDLGEAVSGRLATSGNAPMKGPLKFIDGTPDRPALTFSTNINTGFYKTTTGVGLAINGVQVAEFVAGGLKKGGRFIGELIAYTGSSPQPLTVMPLGQTLSRATYADLWAFAQTEIAAGNAFYNNGNGVDTFGIGDLRGRVVASADGGTGRLPGGTMGAVVGSVAVALSTFHLPPYTPSGSVVIFDPTHQHIFSAFQAVGPTTYNNGVSPGNFISQGTSFSATGITAAFVGSAQGGTSVPFNIMQHTLAASHLLFAGA